MININSFIKWLISLTFLWSLGEKLLPDNNYRRYSSYVYGLLVLLMLTTFVVSLKSFDFSMDRYILESNVSKTDIKEIYEDRMEQILAEKFNDRSIEVYLTDEYKIEKISCKDQKTYVEIMRYLNEGKSD